MADGVEVREITIRYPEGHGCSHCHYCGWPLFEGDAARLADNRVYCSRAHFWSKLARSRGFRAKGEFMVQHKVLSPERRLAKAKANTQPIAIDERLGERPCAHCGKALGTGDEAYRSGERLFCSWGCAWARLEVWYKYMEFPGSGILYLRR